MTELVYATPNDVGTFEPTQVSGWADHTAALAIFGSLVLNFDGRTGQAGYFPWLAKSVEPRGDHCWEITLRPGLTFHDGTPLDAAALKFSFDRVLAPDFPSRRYMHTAPIETITTEGSLRVLVHTREPIAGIVARLLRADAAPVPPSRYGTDPTATAFAPVGAGPFRFIEHRPGDRLVLGVNRDFADPRGEGPPNFERLVMRVIVDPDVLFAEMAEGRVDIAPVSAGLARRVETLSGWRVVAAPDTSRMSFEINQAAHPALADRRVRRAINHAIDVKTLCQRLTGGQGRRIATLVNPPNTAPNLQPYSYDPEQSRALLQEAGYVRGFPLTIDWSTAPDRGELAEAMVPFLEDVGIHVEEVRQLDWSDEYLPGQVSGSLGGLHGHGHAGVEMTAETDLWPVHPEREANSTNWTGDAARRFVELYRNLQQTTHGERQRKIGDELQRIAHDEAISVPFWQLPRRVALSRRVARFLPYPGGHNEDFWSIRMTEEPALVASGGRP